MFATLLLSTLLSVSADTTNHSRQIDEVVVVSSRTEGRKRSVKGALASIDEHLGQLSKVHLVRRGAYASEAIVNNMSTERLSTTIDGMKIFYACTDKMDPVTSYVESGNLQSISLNSGLDGNPQSTGNIGGSIDLKLRKVGFDNDPFAVNFSSGIESNGVLQVYGADASISTHRFYTNFGTFFRKAGCYRAGGNQEIPFSQFQKVNGFANLGYRLGEHDILESTLIYDLATHVGYPALTMDVAKAQGFISSVSYRHDFDHVLLSSIETKLYYNHIVHEMDDTHRPNVQIHMDMPGRSTTAGLYSIVYLRNARHDASFNYDMFFNRRFADMTMYPGEAKPMYMVTWPDVHTWNTGVAFRDVISLGKAQYLNVSTKWAYQLQQINSQEGFDALQVFFPAMKKVNTQVVGRIAAGYAWRPDSWELSIGTGWGSRAPTVTEAYGYYLNNTFDRYDYIGNPLLRNESAIELNAAVNFAPKKLFRGWGGSIGLEANTFFFRNYIVGQFERRLSVMTVGAEGVKVYANIHDARIINTSLHASLVLPRLSGMQVKWDGRLNYALGTDNKGDHLPFIAPWGVTTAVDVSINNLSAQLQFKGDSRQKHYAAKYGETLTSGYGIVNMSAQYRFALQQTWITLRAGVENLFDKYYSTYSDWNKLPQKGRNIYVNLSIGL
jgi:iron complex outermembrane receptor protein